MSNKRWFLPLLLILTLLLVACGGAAPAATPAPEATTVASGQGGDDTDNAEPTRAAAPTEAPADEPTEAAEPTEEPEATPEADDGDDGANAPEGGSIETAEDIETYRFRAEITVEGDAFAEDADMAMFSGGITIEGAFIKEPPASDVAMTIPGLGEVGFREVDGEAYTNFGGEWVSASPDEALDVDDLAPVASDDLVDDLDRMERVGEEEVNGRNTVHYTADKELLQEISEESDDDSFNFADAEEAQLDVWLDEEYGFVVRMELVAEGAGLNDDSPDAEGRVEFTVEYYDFNADDIVIEAPEDVLDVSDDSTGDDSASAEDLPGLLGFDIELPEGSEAEVAFGTATITIPLPADEATELIMTAFEDAGYTLDDTLSSPDAGTLWYTMDDTQWLITITETDGVTEVFIL